MAETLQALRARAVQLHQSGNLNEAGRVYARYLSKAPQDAGIWSNLGVLHRVAGRHLLSVKAQERAKCLAPHDVGFRSNYANILSDIGRYEQSIAERKWVLEREPANLNHLAMIGRCLRGMGRYQDAIDHLNGAITDHPADVELKMQLAFAQLGKGDYAAGFETYKARWQAGELKPRALPFPEWKGEPLKGKTILVMPEQGFGDAVLFARFVPVLREMGATVHCIIERPLAVLLEKLSGADWVGQAVSSTAKIDFWVNMMDLADYHFQTSEVIPAPTALHIPQDSIDRARQITAPFHDKLKVGVIWTGSVTYKGNAFRSFSHTDFMPLTELDDVQLISLYKGPMLEPYFADGSDAFIVDAGSDERGFADTAATMQAMDLIITSDTATAHIAGSLGVPTWTVLHWDPFWVWTHAGEKTPWYPNMRLFRQKTPLNWTEVMQEVKVALATYSKEIK